MQSASETPALGHLPGSSRLGRASYHAGRAARAARRLHGRGSAPVGGARPARRRGLARRRVRRPRRGSYRLALLRRAATRTWYYTTAWMLAHGLLPVTQHRLRLSAAACAVRAHRRAEPARRASRTGSRSTSLVLGPLALLCIYGLAKMIGGRRYAYLVTACWVVAPVVVDPLLPRRLPPPLRRAPAAGRRRPDACSAISRRWSRCSSRRTSSSARLERGDDLDALTAGLAAGLALAIKPANALFLPAAFLGARRRAPAARVRRLRPQPRTCGGRARALEVPRLGYLPLFHSSQVALATGSGPAIPPLGFSAHIGHYLHVDWNAIKRNVDGFREFTWSRRLIEWAVIGGLIGLVRRSLPGAVLRRGLARGVLRLQGRPRSRTSTAGASSGTCRRPFRRPSCS